METKTTGQVHNELKELNPILTEIRYLNQDRRELNDFVEMFYEKEVISVDRIRELFQMRRLRTPKIQKKIMDFLVDEVQKELEKVEDELIKTLEKISIQ
jgi:hypothetical protein